jgi:hypothetical protein
LRQQREQSDQLGHEGVVVIDIEGPDPQVADFAAERTGGQDILHRCI